MDFLSIRKKARERAEARARLPEAAPAADAGSPAPSPAEPPAAPAAAPPAQAAVAPAPVPSPPAAAPPRRPLPPAPAAAPGGALEADLRAELSRLDADRDRPADPRPAEAAPAPAPAQAPLDPLDPLDEFFWREDETAPLLPDLGLGAAGRPAAEPPTDPPREYVAFLLGEEEYAVAIEAVREVLKPPPITEVPGAPAHVAGVITLRGEVVTVADPRWALALPPVPLGPRSRLLVCQTDEGLVALRVDAVSEVIRLPAAAIEPRPPGITGDGTAALVGIGREGKRLVILLDLETLVRSAEPQGAT